MSRRAGAMSRGRGLTVAALLALGPPAAAAKVSLIVSDESQARAAGARAGKNVRVRAFDRILLSDPLEKERFLAALRASDRVIAAAGCGWLAREVERVPVDCVTPYNAGQVLDFARAAGWRRLAAVHMRGYEKVFDRLRARARARGIELVAVRVERSRDLTAALPQAMETAQAVWVLGDPLLTEGPAFDYLVETALARRVPLIAPGAELVDRGVFLGADCDPADLLRRSLAVANAAAKEEAPNDSAMEVSAGRLVVNRVLARRWGVRVPGSP